MVVCFDLLDPKFLMRAGRLKKGAGWADAMAKVLAMGKNSEKTVGVLSKAKKDNAKEKDSEGKVLEPLALRKARKRELDSIGR